MSSTALRPMLQAKRMRYHFFVLGLTLQLIACGDDSEGPVPDAGGGSGGEGGAAARGGVGGRASRATVPNPSRTR